MQNLVAILGSAGAATFLNLLDSNYRVPAWSVLALNPDGSTIFDLTPYLISAEPVFDDEGGKSAKATFVFANPNGMFNRYSGSHTTVFVENVILRYQKGYVNPSTSDSYIIPAFYGLMAQIEPIYDLKNPTITVTCGDALKNAVRQKFTSDPYTNTEVNLIATNLLERYGAFPSGQIALTSVSHPYAFAQFPDMTLVDDLQMLFDPLVFYVRADEAGNVTTGPRLGSQLSSFAGLLGYPDQQTPPSADYILPAELIENIYETTQDWDGVINQVRVLGQTTVTTQSLGPYARLYGPITDSSLAANGVDLNKYLFGQGTANDSQLAATNVIIVLAYSTTHQLDTAPQYLLLSMLNWTGTWSSSAAYQPGDAAEYTDGQAYACTQAANSSNPPGGATNAFWQKLTDPTGTLPNLNGPYFTSVNVENSDPHTVGFAAIKALTETYVVLDIEGRQYSVNHGLGGVVHHGGFDFNFYILGSPLLIANTALTAYADYNPAPVTGETLTNPFGDQRTWQAAHVPFAMSQGVTAFLNTGSGAVSLGTIAADQTTLSGEENFSVDYERGRVVLTTAAYQDWSEDDDASHPLSTGGFSGQTTQVFTLTGLAFPAPQSVYQSRRDGASTYQLPGLVVGQGYDIRLHFADPTPLQPGQRKFSVYCQDAKVVAGLDIIAAAGGNQKNAGNRLAYQTTISGQTPDSNGVIKLQFTQFDPSTGVLLPECSNNGKSTGSPLGSPIVSGIEVLYPQGQGPNAYTVNCGGAELSPAGVTVTANYSYSPVQQEYGIQKREVNDPLIATQTDAQNIANYNVNYAQWKRHRHKIQAASVPHLQPGDLIEYADPLTGVLYWSYLQAITRRMEVNQADRDEFIAYLIYVNPPSVTFQVNGIDNFWVFTGLVLPANTGLMSTASGTVNFGAGTSGPAGVGAPVPTNVSNNSANQGLALAIVPIGSGPPSPPPPSPYGQGFCPGTSATYTPAQLPTPNGGEVWAIYNDIVGGFGNNSGFFSVTLTRL